MTPRAFVSHPLHIWPCTNEALRLLILFLLTKLLESLLRPFCPDSESQPIISLLFVSESLGRVSGWHQPWRAFLLYLSWHWFVIVIPGSLRTSSYFSLFFSGRHLFWFRRCPLSREIWRPLGCKCFLLYQIFFWVLLWGPRIDSWVWGSPRHLLRADPIWKFPSKAFPGLFPPPGPASQSAAQPPTPEDAYPVQGVSPRPHHCHR